MKKKKNKNSYLATGLGTITSGIAIGSIPDISGTASETTIKTNAMTGLTNVSKTFPAIGSMKGTGMVFDSLGKLNKKSKRILKGGRL